MIIFKTLIYLIILYLFYFSIKGFESFFFKKEILKNKNHPINYFFLLTIIILNIIGFLIYCLSIKTDILSIFIFITGIIIFFINIKLIKIDKQELILIVLLFSGILISKTHEDFIPYHLPFLHNIYTETLTLGLSNKEFNFIYSPFFSYFQYLVFNNFFNYDLVNIPLFIILINFINILFKLIQKEKVQTIILLILSIILIKHARFSEYGYDLITQIILIKIFLIYFFDLTFKKNNTELTIYYIFFLYAVSIKVISLIFLPFIIYITIKKKIKNNLKNK